MGKSYCAGEIVSSPSTDVLADAMLVDIDVAI